MDSRPAPSLDDLDSLSSLADPVRRRLYEVVAEAGRPLRRDVAADAAGIGRSLAAYHLDRLAEEGLLEVSFGRPEGRGGPGAGRPAKLYHRAEREFVLHAPPRDYALLAEIFLRADEGDAAARDAVERAARGVGRELGRAAAGVPVEEVLRQRGYEPFDDGEVLRFRNCPFHALATTHRRSVCGLNLALVEGILAGATARGLQATLEPDRAACCVAVGPRRRNR
jgi:predicted ArsR family transcriptional regulator